VGIVDDVSHTSLDVDPAFSVEPPSVMRAVFYGLGADGTVGANKNSAKIIAEDAGLYTQAYFVYDSHKSGAQTVSHLRFGPEPIRAPYLIASAGFVACHVFGLLMRQDVLRLAAPGGVFLLNSAFAADAVWDHLPRSVQQQIIDKRLRFYVIDASRVAREVGLGVRTNTALQTCFFAISGVLPREAAIKHIKEAIRRTYAGKGETMVHKNYAAVDATLDQLNEVQVPPTATSVIDRPSLVPDDAPDFVRRVTAPIMIGRGDEIPVSLLPSDGTFPSGTAAWEKRNISDIVAAWEPELCIQCGQCAFVCPQVSSAPNIFTRTNSRGHPRRSSPRRSMPAAIRKHVLACSSMKRTARAAASASKPAWR
jgi:pyruvate-ferredoxin/flavodoxin oxidoreductase